MSLHIEVNDPSLIAAYRAGRIGVAIVVKRDGDRGNERKPTLSAFRTYERALIRVQDQLRIVTAPKLMRVFEDMGEEAARELSRWMRENPNTPPQPGSIRVNHDKLRKLLAEVWTLAAAYSWRWAGWLLGVEKAAGWDGETKEPLRLLPPGAPASTNPAVIAGWDTTDPWVVELLKRRGANWARMENETVRRVNDYVSRAVTQTGPDGYLLSRTEMVDGIRKLFTDMAPWRAERILRTELMQSTNLSTLSRYQEADVVEEVEAVDGDDDPVCAARNGQRFTLAAAAAETESEHPNGTLAFIPIVKL